MTKSIVSSAQVSNINEIANYGERLFINAVAPINYTEAVVGLGVTTSGTALGAATLTKSLGAGSFSLQNGVTSGKRLTIMSLSTIPVSVTGNANHVAIVSDTRSALLLVTSLTSQAVTAGNTAQTSSFDLEVRDPT